MVSKQKVDVGRGGGGGFLLSALKSKKKGLYKPQQWFHQKVMCLHLLISLGISLMRIRHLGPQRTDSLLSKEGHGNPMTCPNDFF